MDLKTVFSSIIQKVGGQKGESERFISVKVSASQVVAATWKVTAGKVSLGKVAQSQILKEGFDGLLEACDQAVSQIAETGQQPETFVEKVIFGLPFYWVSEGKVIPEKLSDLKRLCKELDFKPLGFVLLTEALENYYKEVEGAPLTAILVEVDGDQGFLTMYRAGKNLGSVEMKISGQINEEIEKALKSFTAAEVLPSRIIVYDSQADLEKLAEKITAHPWTKTLPFLHFPKVEVLPGNSMVKAIAVAGGMEMGGHFEISDQPFQPPDQSPKELEEVSAEEAGFLPETEFVPPPPEALGQLQEMGAPVEAPVPSLDLSFIKGKLAGLLAGFFRLLARLPSRPKSSFIPLAGIVGAIIFLLLAISVYAIPKVKIIIKVNSPQFDKELATTVVTDRTTKVATDSSKTLTGALVDATEIGSKKGVTTGQKLVGDKAKGNVTIYSAASAKDFAAGTTITSSTGLKFTLDKDTSVASGDAITRATTTVAVTAADIGDSYNLSAGTKFTIGTFSSSDYAAQTDQGLSGGNSHQANVVTKEDQNRLIATLSAELTDKARADLEAKLSPGQKLLPAAISSNISKKKFSKDIGTEGDTVSLDLTMDFSGVIFSESDLVDLFAKNYASDIPSGFVLTPDRANIEIKDVKIDNSGAAILKVHLVAALLPRVDNNELIKNVSGKSLSVASTYLLKIPGVSAITIETKPKIFEGLVKLALPWKKENISLEVVTQ